MWYAHATEGTDHCFQMQILGGKHAKDVHVCKDFKSPVFLTIYSNINPVCNLIQQKRIEFYSQHSTCIGCFGPNLAVGIFVPHIEVWNFFH